MSRDLTETVTGGTVLPMTTTPHIALPDETYIPAEFVKVHADRCSTVDVSVEGGYYRRSYSVHYLDLAGVDHMIGTVSSFRDGSGWSAYLTKTRETSGLHLSTTTKTRRNAIEYLVATVAGLRWHS